MGRTSNLLGRMIENMPPHRVVARGLTEDVTDTLGCLDMVSATEADLEIPYGGARVILDRSTRQFVSERPEVIWVADLRASDGTGTLTPFAPPRTGVLNTTIPLRVDESFHRRLRDLRLPVEGDLLTALQLNAGHRRVAVLGMRTIAALDADDSRRVTWWVPSGGALEMRVEDDGSGGTVLALIDVVLEVDAHNANTGPNLLLRLHSGARLPIVGRDEGTGPPTSAVGVFHPTRSRLFDAWARYTAIARKEHDDRQIARGAHPLTYRDASQQGPRWRVQATVTQEQCEAWLGSDPQEHREVKVDQQAAVVNGQVDRASVTVEKATLRGPGQVELLVRLGPGERVLPEGGVLAARENRGEKVRLERERTALDLLTRGAAACSRLPLLLATPELATPPTVEPLRPTAASPLDASQEAAVQAIVGCHDLVAVQGPPGTGKTAVFAEALRQIAAKGRRDGRNYRVLVSSGQNEAISNLMQRLTGVEGVLVHVVERAARDEDEGFRFASRLAETREWALAKLGGRLERSQIAERLRRVQQAEDTLDDLRALAATGPQGGGRLAEQLRAVADDDEALFGHFEREEARAIAAALDAAIDEAQEHGALPTEFRPLPADAADVANWWEAAGPSWPATNRAAVAAAVRDVAAAMAQHPLRRDLTLKLALPRLKSAVEQTPRTSVQLPVTTRTTTEVCVDTWLAGATRRLRESTAAITASPDAIAWHFLRALRDDPQAWARIVERHGNAVAATCSMSARAQPEPGDAYDWVIIDEAGHATPFELMIPMVQGRRIVLIGDHRQLPPMVDDAIARRASADGEAPLDFERQTLFGEMFRLLPHTNALRLRIQYRMHEVIGSMVDAIFYRPFQEGLTTHFRGDRVSPKWMTEVVTPDGVLAVPRSRGMFEDAPVAWYEVAPAREYGEVNPEEARAVVELLVQYAAAGVDARDIAVICPYRQQRAEIEGELRKAQIPGSVFTIDAVQGREYPIVLLCLVRTDRRAGFLASPNRLNVAISRAQRQLVFVGKASAFLRSDRVRQRAPELHQVVTEAIRLGSVRRRGA